MHEQEALLGSLSQQLRHAAGRAYAGLRWSDGATAAATTAGEESDMHCLRHPRLHYTRWLSRVLVERPGGAAAALVRVFAAWTVGLKSPSMTLREQVCTAACHLQLLLCVCSAETVYRLSLRDELGVVQCYALYISGIAVLCTTCSEALFEIQSITSGTVLNPNIIVFGYHRLLLSSAGCCTEQWQMYATAVAVVMILLLLLLQWHAYVRASSYSQ
jgi:hypothetical protein